MKRIANLHLAINLGAVVVFAVNLWLRFRLPAESNLTLGLSIVRVLAIGLGGWLGGEMVYVKGMELRRSRNWRRRSRVLATPGRLTSTHAPKYPMGRGEPE